MNKKWKWKVGRGVLFGLYFWHVDYFYIIKTFVRGVLEGFKSLDYICMWESV